MNKPLDQKVFNMASNLFGVHTSTKAEQFITLSVQPKIENCLMAVYPVITQEAYSLIMDRFRVYIAIYNDQTRAENEQIQRHNKKLDARKIKNPLSDTEKKLSEMFYFRNSELTGRRWNEAADEFNEQNGLLIHKEKIQTVKVQTESVFANFLHLYSKQLSRRTEEYMRLRVMNLRPLQEFKVNSQEVANLKRNGVISLDLCKKTIRNHRQRLEECGVLVDYHFQGANRAVQVHINPEIMAIFDLKTSKLVFAENQRLTLPGQKELPDSNVSTRTVIKEYEIKENALGDSRDKEFAALTPKPFVFYKNTNSKEQNLSMPAPPDGVKISETLHQLATPSGRFAKTASTGTVIMSILPKQSDPPQSNMTIPAAPPGQDFSKRLLAMVIDPQQLAEELFAGMHDNYSPIDIRLLEREAYKGTLTEDEFRELFIQDFFKNSAKLYRGKSVYVGSWKNAINHYYDVKFKHFNQKSFSKTAMLDEVPQFRWRLEHSRKWFAKNQEVNILFPSQYFDVSRDTAKEVGFEYTKKAWKKKLQYDQNSELRKRKREAASDDRKKRVNFSKKATAQLNKFFKNQIDLPQLTEYFDKHLPQNFRDELPNLIQKHHQKSMQNPNIKLSENRPTSAFDDDFLRFNLYEF